MKIKYIIVSVMIILLFISTQNTFAGGRKLGTSAASELLIPMGARSVGMGGANIANVTMTDAIYWNPAGLAALQSAEVGFSYMTYFADMKVSYFTLGYYLEGISSTMGVTMQAMDIGEIIETTIEDPEGTGKIITPQYLTFNISFARLLTDHIRFGLNTKVISERIGNMSASAVAWDFGIQYISELNIDFGITLKNLGTSMQFDGTGIEFDSSVPWANPNATTRKTKADITSNELPTSLQMGLAYRINMNEQSKLNLTGAYASNSFNIDLAAGGAEYSYQDFVFLRLGYEMPLYTSDFPSSARDYQYGINFGAGVDLDFQGTVLSINYAYRDMDLFDGNNYFTLNFQF
jgi:Type IX secretion system protein PorV